MRIPSREEISLLTYEEFCNLQLAAEQQMAASIAFLRIIPAQPKQTEQTNAVT